VSEIPWEARFSEADAVIRELIATLPPEIRHEAERVPFILEKWPPADAPQDQLGLYMSFEQSVVSDAPGPIMIYIGPHLDFCEEEDLDFKDEIRRTYLHELGHHLGLDEGELEDRELD
jgi:predicted Zn-dependent protease with MMP-like domain